MKHMMSLQVKLLTITLPVLTGPSEEGSFPQGILQIVDELPHWTVHVETLLKYPKVYKYVKH